MADFFDLVLIGEGEEVLGELLDLYHTHRQARAKRTGKHSCCRPPGWKASMSRHSTMSTYNADGTVAAIRPNRPGVPARIRKRIIRDLDAASFPVGRTWCPNTEIVHDRMYLEVFRGCPRGCRFCQAGMIYRPVREKQAATLIGQALDQEAGNRLRRNRPAVAVDQRLQRPGPSDRSACSAS